MLDVHYSSARTGTGRDDWETPPGIMSAAISIAWAGTPTLAPDRGWFDIDLAANTSNAKARLWLGPDGRRENALDVEWDSLAAEGDSLRAFLNPPYSKLKPFLKKCAESRRLIIVALIPARTDTEAWHEYVMGAASEVYFIRGRVKFVGAPAGAPFPSALVAYNAVGRSEATAFYSLTQTRK